MKKLILVRYEEIFLKGDNKALFENKLIYNMRNALYGLGKMKVRKGQSRIFVEPMEEGYPVEEAMTCLTRVFGIASVSPCVQFEVTEERIAEEAVKAAQAAVALHGYKTFKVETRRADKRFPKNSMQVSREMGGLILSAIPQLKVDVHKPDFVVHIEIRDMAYVYSVIIPCAKGLPTGSGGKGMLLLSGGIDSPVAGYMIAKRGATIEAVHFYSYPYTSERAKDKVIALAKILGTWCRGVKLHVVPFTEIQDAINNTCVHDYGTIIMRRFMMRIAERIAIENGAQALVTGEAIGQVASQTMESMLVTNSVVKLPVYRPCIGMDKNEVIDIARRIDTFETSILPYEDCCTVFVAKHPVTRPTMEKTEKFEQGLEMEALIERALAGVEIVMC